QQLNSHEPQIPGRPPSGQPVTSASWWRGITSPLVVLFIAVIVMVALVFFGFGASTTNTSQPSSTNTASSNTNTSSTSMGTTSSSTAPANVPNATQVYGGQLATYVVDPDGAKHFTFTAEQVMWEVTTGHRVLAWTVNGTVPGPMIRVTAGDHIRVTLINHFP